MYFVGVSVREGMRAVQGAEAFLPIRRIEGPELPLGIWVLLIGPIRTGARRQPPHLGGGGCD